jgi:hypothetical protein
MRNIFRIFLISTLILFVAGADAEVIKDENNPVDIYTGANTTPTIRAEMNGAVTLGTANNTNTHTMRGPVTFQDNSAGTASADIRLRGGGIGFTHSALRLESTGQGRGGGVYYLNTFGQRNWFFGIPYMASGDSDSFVINRRTTTSATHQADTSDPLDSDVVNLMRVSSIQSSFRGSSSNTLNVTRTNTNAANATGVAFFNDATDFATHYSALYGYSGSARARAFAFDAVGAGGFIGEATPAGTWTFGPSGFTGTHQVRGGLTMTRHANSTTRLQIVNLDGGTSAYGEVVLINDVGNAAGLFRNSSAQTGYAGANSINLGASSAIPIGMVYNNALRMRIDNHVKLENNAALNSNSGSSSINANSCGGIIFTLPTGQDSMWKVYATHFSGGCQGHFTHNVVTIRGSDNTIRANGVINNTGLSLSPTTGTNFQLCTTCGSNTTAHWSIQRIK